MQKTNHSKVIRLIYSDIPLDLSPSEAEPALDKAVEVDVVGDIVVVIATRLGASVASYSPEKSVSLLPSIRTGCVYGWTKAWLIVGCSVILVPLDKV